MTPDNRMIPDTRHQLPGGTTHVLVATHDFDEIVNQIGVVGLRILLAYSRPVRMVTEDGGRGVALPTTPDRYYTPPTTGLLDPIGAPAGNPVSQVGHPAGSAPEGREAAHREAAGADPVNGPGVGEQHRQRVGHRGVLKHEKRVRRKKVQS